MKKETKKKKKGKEEEAGARNIAVEGKKLDKEGNLYPPQMNEKQEYKIYEFGNYPFNAQPDKDAFNQINALGSSYKPNQQAE